MSLLQRAIAQVLVSAVLLAAVSSSSGAQAAPRATIKPPERATLRAARRTGAIVLDGRLDDAAWQQVEAAKDFTQSWPNFGKPATDPMEVRVVYDDDAMYVGVRLYDAHPDSIAAQLARRDAGGIYSDWVHLIIDSYYDRRTAFRFTVNPKGVQKDVFTSNDGNEDVNWDAVWDVATRIDSVGWVAEYRIPLSQLRFADAPAGAERVWGFQVMRDVARRSERDAFSPWRPEDPGFVSKFGDLVGLVNIPQPKRLEVLPYVSSKVTRAPGDATNPFYKRTDAQPNAGADIRYGLKGGLTLTATINPDFGQVEVDPSVVNLSAFETFFPEKRPFFLEGSDVFSFGQVRRNNDYGSQTFFYTRRVGRPPSRFPSGPTVGFVDMPDQTRILGAAKVTGKRGPWTIGLLDALTSQEHATVASPTGAIDSTTIVEPKANYFAGRVRRDFRGGQSVVGGMLTLANRQQSSLFTNLLTSAGGFGGVDFEHRWLQGKYIVSGFAAASRVNASTPVISGLQRNSSHYFQRPDATRLNFDPTRSSLSGDYEEIAISKTGKWFGSLALKQVSPGFEINDVGFHGRVDYRAVSPFFGYSSNEKNGWSMSRFAGAWTNHTWNYDRTPIYQGFGSSANATFTNFWNAGFGAGGNFKSFNDRLLRGGPLALNPASWYVNAFANTDTRRRIWLSPSVNYTRYVGDPSFNMSANIYADARPSSTVHVTFGPSLFKQYSTSQHVKSATDPLATHTYGARYAFANLHQTVLSLDTRIEWTLTSKLSLQSYFQPFVAVGRYEGFKEFAEPRTYNFTTYAADQITSNFDAEGHVTSYTVDTDGAGPAQAFSFRNPNFNSHSLQGNAVLRWEYRPGSTLYFVWQQERGGAGDAFQFDTRSDVGAIFRDRPTNIFLVKASYWLSR